MPNKETIKAIKKCETISKNDDIVKVEKNRRLSKRSCTKMIKEIVSKNSFKQDFKKATKQGFIKEAEIAEIDKIIQLLANNQP